MLHLFYGFLYLRKAKTKSYALYRKVTLWTRDHPKPSDFLFCVSPLYVHKQLRFGIGLWPQVGHTRSQPTDNKKGQGEGHVTHNKIFAPQNTTLKLNTFQFYTLVVVWWNEVYVLALGWQSGHGHVTMRSTHFKKFVDPSYHWNKWSK